MSEQKHKLLEVKDLKVSFFTPAGEVKAVGGISYDLDYGEVMGVVGESGSGKSQEAYSIMGLLQSPGKVVGGSITFEGQDVLSFTKDQMTEFRGSKVAMIFQNPMTCLNPVYTIGNQLVEALRAHDKKISQLSAGNPISHKADSYKHKNQRRPFTVPYFAGFQFIHFLFSLCYILQLFFHDLFPLVQTVASGVSFAYNISVLINKESFRESGDSIKTSVHHSGIRDQEWIGCLGFLLKYLSLFHCFLILLSTALYHHMLPY